MNRTILGGWLLVASVAGTQVTPISGTFSHQPGSPTTARPRISVRSRPDLGTMESSEVNGGKDVH